jgi:hypothetical protein
MLFALLLLAFVPAGLARADEPKAAVPNDTLVNGLFNQPLATGWQQQVKDYVGGHEIRLLKDGGVKVRKEMCGRAAISQDVKLTVPDVSVSARTYFAAEATNMDYYSFSLLSIGYLDKAGKDLGETRIYASAGAVPWKNSATLHLIPVKEKRKWLDTELDITEELKANLKGVDPAKVKALRITFEAFGSGTSAC